MPLDRARKIALGAERRRHAARAVRAERAGGWALAIFSLAYFGQQSWSTLVMILPADIFPRSAVGAVAGLVGFGGAMGGVVFGQVVGWLLDAGFGYGVVFALAGSFHVLAFASICLAIPRIEALDRSTSMITVILPLLFTAAALHPAATIASGWLTGQLPDAPYEETPPAVVERMLKLADLHGG